MNKKKTSTGALLSKELKTKTDEIIKRAISEGKSPYVSVLIFKYLEQSYHVYMLYDCPIDSPRREEVVLVKFIDMAGKKRKISASVKFVISNFIQNGTVSGVQQDAYVNYIYLYGEVEQPA